MCWFFDPSLVGSLPCSRQQIDYNMLYYPLSIPLLYTWKKNNKIHTFFIFYKNFSCLSRREIPSLIIIIKTAWLVMISITTNKSIVLRNPSTICLLHNPNIGISSFDFHSSTKGLGELSTISLLIGFSLQDDPLPIE